MGRKRTQTEEKYLKRRRYYLKSKGYSDEEIEKILNETAEDPLFDSIMNDIDLVNNFNKTLLNLNEGKMNTNNLEEIIETNEEIDETKTNDKTFTNTNDKTNDNVFVNDDTNINSDTNTNTNTNKFVSDNVKFEFDDNLKNEDNQFTEQQQQATQDQEDNKEGGSISGKMFMLTVNILLTSASKFIKKDITLDEQEINEFAKLYDEAYPEGLPISPKYVFWGGLAMTITTKAMKK